ncbi:MAG: hypothetical protein C0446_08470 [Chitinophaga sp.]|nr:hypothetical protein [Chitinophaga sp.]
MQEFSMTILDNAKRMLEDAEFKDKIIEIQKASEILSELSVLEVAMEYLEQEQEEKWRRMDFMESRF